ncbi:hydrolase family protein / HAD-superfamily protein [Euphorbia peplus]|nr:hydrolase family protein / HAD-superfamily protein [Euphorbia peplus]
MRYLAVIRKGLRCRKQISISEIHSQSGRSTSSSSSSSSSFGIAFDIDGVILRGESPIGASPHALHRLYDPSGALRIPYIFLTNGGGFPEAKRALELSKLVGVDISPLQVLQGHTPFKQLLNRFENKLVVAVGKGEPAAVMSGYGFKNVVSIDEYTSYFDGIDPLAQYKTWTTKQTAKHSINTRDSLGSQRVQAAFIVSDSVDWSRDIQVLCDILRTGGLPGRELGHQPLLYFANDDLAYQATFPSERLGMGAFRIALEAVFNSIHPTPLEYTSFGKPNPLVFKNAETVLKELASSLPHVINAVDHENEGARRFNTLYMVGDNPAVDIRGAREAGHPWFSILTRTGVFRGAENHKEFAADLVVDTVEDAVDYILTKECT